MREALAFLMWEYLKVFKLLSFLLCLISKKILQVFTFNYSKEDCV